VATFSIDCCECVLAEDTLITEEDERADVEDEDNRNCSSVGGGQVSGEDEREEVGESEGLATAVNGALIGDDNMERFVVEGVEEPESRWLASPSELD